MDHNQVVSLLYLALDDEKAINDGLTEIATSIATARANRAEGLV